MRTQGICCFKHNSVANCQALLCARATFTTVPLAMFLGSGECHHWGRTPSRNYAALVCFVLPWNLVSLLPAGADVGYQMLRGHRGVGGAGIPPARGLRGHHPPRHGPPPRHAPPHGPHVHPAPVALRLRQLQGGCGGLRLRARCASVLYNVLPLRHYFTLTVLMLRRWETM